VHVILLFPAYPAGSFLQGLKIFLRKTASKDLFRPSGRAKTALEKHLFQPRKNILASRRKNRAAP
jgi:hypothetical protein